VENRLKQTRFRPSPRVVLMLAAAALAAGPLAVAQAAAAGQSLAA
jgi:hypothetical protein